MEIAVSSIKTLKLTCEYAVNPLEIDVSNPRFSWVLESDQRGQMQSAYQIMVASSKEELSANVGDKWDSGKVVSEHSVNVAYEGTGLASGEKCWWKVRVWDKDGKVSPFSRPATFEMSLLKDSDWQGKWIAHDEDLKQDKQIAINAPLLRKEFEIARKISSARAYFSGLGWGELYINGENISNDVLSPAFTDYFKEIKYRTYDVTEFLRQGSNAIGIMLGNGWFSGLEIFGGTNTWGKKPQAILQVVITYDDGAQQSFFTDGSWKTTTGPVGLNCIRLGERYDARLEKPLWDTADYDDSQWKCASIVPSPGGQLVCQRMPDMKVRRTISPIRLTNPQKDVWLFEFDRFFAGWIRLNVKGKAGTRIDLAYSSRILENGLIDKSMWPDDKQTDIYILNGDPDGEIYEPRFIFHPVQYVQVTGLEERPTIETLTGCEVYSGVDMYGSFTCSNELFNQIHDNIQNTLKIALKGLILDCLHREPIAYNEPATISASLWTRKFMPNLWTKVARDIQLGSSDKGFLSDIVPVPPDMQRDFDVSQNGNYPMLIWYLYQCYGDERLIQQHYQRIRDWVDYITMMADDKHIIGKGWVGDHMLPGLVPGGEKYMSDETPKPLIWTCLYYHNARTLANMAQVLGNKKDSQSYTDLAEEIKKTINDTWLDKETSHYGSQSQTSEILPLAIGIVPQEHKKNLIGNIADTITEVDGGKLRVGHAGIIGFFESLVDSGLGEIIYDVVNQTDYPGWGYMVSHGATTLWENWSRYGGGGSYNGADNMIHLGGVCRFFYNSIAGIQEPDFYGPRQFVPGYGHIAIKPHVLGDLTHASASIRTVRGIVSSSWERTSDSLTLKVIIPVNSQAKVSVPKMGLGNIVVGESGKHIWKDGSYVDGVAEIVDGNESDDYVKFDVGSGSYVFQLTGQQ